MNKPEITLGKIIEDDADRDAIHIAILPVIAVGKLTPGQDIGLLKDGRVGACNHPIGIVDPFLTGMIFKDQKFWMLLYPNTITSLRHDWTHPAFSRIENIVLDDEDENSDCYRC